MIFLETQKFSFIQFLTILHIALDRNLKMGSSKRKLAMKCCRALLTIRELAICCDWLYRQAECYIDVVISRAFVWTQSASGAFLTRSLHMHYGTNIIKPAFNACTVTNIAHPTLPATLNIHTSILPIIRHYTRNSDQLKTIINILL